MIKFESEGCYINKKQVEIIEESLGGASVEGNKDYRVIVKYIWINGNDTMHVIGTNNGNLFGYRYFKVGGKWNYSYDYRE